VPWMQLCALIEPVYPKGGSGEGGRPPVPLERMLRIYLLQLWFNLSDPAVEEALYDSAAMRASRASTWVVSRRPMRRRFANSATFWRNTSWAGAVQGGEPAPA